MPADPLHLALVAAISLAAIVLVLHVRLHLRLRSLVHEEVAQWKDRELAAERTKLDEAATREATLTLERWKTEQTHLIRKDAIERSRATTHGKIFEQLVPYLPDFPFNPADARFIGAPIDLVVFDGLGEDRLEEVVFVEVKTGESDLSTRERRVRDAIREGRVSWKLLRVKP